MVDNDRLAQHVTPGDPQVCETLMRAYYDFAYNLAASFLLDPDEAEDVAQETFIRAMKNLDHYQDGTSMKSWLGKITINLCRDRYRRRKTRRRLVDLLKMWIMPFAPETSGPEDTLIENEKQQTLRRAIDGLDEKHRLPVLLRYRYELTVPEIAQALSLSEGTVASRLHYAHLKLRSRLGELNGDSKISPRDAEGLE